MLLTNIHIFIHVRLIFFHGVKSHGVYEICYLLWFAAQTHQCAALSALRAMAAFGHT
jgi:hypothetical protein